MAIEWWICPAVPTTQNRGGRSSVMLKHEWIISVAKYVFYRIQKVLWQCSDIIHRIRVFIENDQIFNTLVVNDLLHHYRNDLISIDHAQTFGYIFPPTVLHTLTLPSQHASLILDSSEKSKQDHLFGTVKLRVLAGPPSSSSGPVLETNVRFLYSNTTVEWLTTEPSLDSSYRSWMSRELNKLLCDCGPVSEIGITLQAFQDSVHHRLWSSLDDHYLAIFAIYQFLICCIEEVEQSNLSAIRWELRPASLNSTTIFCCCYIR